MGGTLAALHREGRTLSLALETEYLFAAIPAVTTRHTTDALLEEYRASLALLERVIDMLRALPLKPPFLCRIGGKGRFSL